MGSIAVFGICRLLVRAPAAPAMPAGGALLATTGVAMIAALWTYEGPALGRADRASRRR